MAKRYTFRARQLEAWGNAVDGFDVNNVWNIGEFSTSARDEARAFTRYLKRCGITFRKGCTRIWCDGDNYTIEDRKTGEPLFDAVLIDY